MRTTAPLCYSLAYRKGALAEKRSARRYVNGVTQCLFRAPDLYIGGNRGASEDGGAAEHTGGRPIGSGGDAPRQQRR